MFGTIITLVGGARGPVPSELSLGLTAPQPVEAHVHGLESTGNNSVVDNPHRCRIVGLDRGGGLGPTHFKEGFPKGDHFLSRDEESC